MLRANELIVDLFAGGGGASEGIRMALGRDPDIAVNHDPVAVAMHEANHPSTRHLRQDVWQVPPRWATRGRPVGLLWASPDCKHFSKAKGAAPKRDVKIRDLAWVVEKWAREVRPRVILLENVEEFRTWGPLDKDGRIIKSQKGTTFRAFVNALRALGYRVDWRELRACDYGAPTIRNRLFMIARCDGLSITWPELTHGPRRALPYRTAADIIDWTIPCPSIFDRRKPLAEATLRRIAAGIKRYVLGAADPFIISIDHRGSGDGSIRSMGDPLTTITRKNRHALVTAFLAKHYGGVVGQDVVFPIGTITTVDHHGLVTANLTRFHGKSVGSDLTEAMPTVMGHAKDGLISSHLVKLRGTCRDGQGVKVPMPTITSGGLHVGEVRAFLMKYYGTGGQLQSCSSPMHTIPTRDRMGLVTVRIGGEPYVIADIGMRMLTPRELFRAQGFPDSYRIDIDVDGRRISKADQVRMCGNSVCPQVAEVLVRKNMERAKLSNSMQSTEYFQLNMLGNV